ncbi:hypothetical protein E8E13_007945 [Curvularia kusanoi]|uniref:Uncharacterized protein n=1 Tax=Curvularia kusanoi TaxID=90978 RepID=A0A9P4W8G1_CURKU|nr:hypothetical protein E8E13_007945 [Curvularia kusanoi]
MSLTNPFNILNSVVDNETDSTTTPASRPSSPSSSDPYSLPPRVMSWADEAEEEEDMKKVAAAAAAEANAGSSASEEDDRWETLGRARRGYSVDEEIDGDDEEDDSFPEDDPVEEYVAEEYYNSDDDMMDPVDDQGKEITEGYIDDVPLPTFSEGDATPADHHDASGMAQAELRAYPKSEPALATDSWETFTAKLQATPSLTAPLSPAELTAEPIKEVVATTERPETPDALKGMDFVARYWWSKPVTDTPVADSWNEYVARFPEHCKKIGLRPITPEDPQNPIPEEDEVGINESTCASTEEASSAPSEADAVDVSHKQAEDSTSEEPWMESIQEPDEDQESSEVLQTHILVTEPVELPPSPNASTEEVKPSGRASDSWDDFVAQTPVVWATEPSAVAADDTGVVESAPPSSPPGTLPHARNATASTPTTTPAPATPLKDINSTPSGTPEVMSSPLHEIVERLKKPSIFTLDGQRDKSPTPSPARLTGTKSVLPPLQEVNEEEHEVTGGAEEAEILPDTDAQHSRSSPKTFGRHASARRELAKASKEAIVQTTEPSQNTGVVAMATDVEDQQVVPTERSRKSKRKTKRAGKAAAVAKVSPNTDTQTTAKSTMHSEDLLEMSSDLAPEESMLADSDVTVVATPISEAEFPEQAESVRVQKNMYEVLDAASSLEESVDETDDVVVNNTGPDEDDNDFVDAQEIIDEPAVVSKEPDSKPKKNKKSRTKAQRRRAAEARAAQTRSSATQTSTAAMSRDQEMLRRRAKPNINVVGRDATFITVTPTISARDQATFEFGNAAHPVKKTIRARLEDMLVGSIRIGDYNVPWTLILLMVSLLYGGWLIAQVVS